MIIKHSGFDDSAVMRELERLEAKKNPDAVWKPEPVVKKASSFKSEDPFHNMIVLVAKLREAGRIEDADRLMTKVAAYQANVHLYRAIDEDGDDLLEFAHPEGDVEVAPAQNEHGKVHTPQSAHKKIVDIVNKTPTGKYADSSNLLSKIASDLGLKKKASSVDKEIGELIKDFKVIVTQWSGSKPQYLITSIFPSKSAIELQVSTYNTKVCWTDKSDAIWSRGVDDIVTSVNGNNTSAYNVNSGQWGIFKKFAGEKNVQQAYKEFIRRSGMQKTPDSSREGRQETFQEVFGPLVTIATNRLNVAISGIVSNIEKLESIWKMSDVSKLESTIQSLVKSISASRWLLDLMVAYNDDWMKPIKRILNDLLVAVNKKMAEIKPLIQNKLNQQDEQIGFDHEALIMGARFNYAKALELAKMANNQRAYNYCWVMVNEMLPKPPNLDLENVADWLESPWDSVKINNNARTAYGDIINTFSGKFTNRSPQAIARVITQDSIATLNKIQQKKSSSKRSLNKVAVYGDDEGPQDLKPIPHQPKPVTKKTTTPNNNFKRFYNWNKNLLAWQEQQTKGSAPSDWYKSVEELQNALYSLGDKNVLTEIQKKHPEVKFDISSVSNIIQNLGGMVNSKGGHKNDGKWGEGTSKSVLAAKALFKNLGMDDLSQLAVDSKGYLGSATSEAKNKVGEMAKNIAKVINDVKAKIVGTETKTETPTKQETKPTAKPVPDTTTTQGLGTSTTSPADIDTVDLLIWPRKWADSSLQINRLKIGSRPISDYLPNVINLNQAMTINGIDNALNILISAPIGNITFNDKLQALGLNGKTTSTGKLYNKLDPYSPEASIVNSKFKAYVVFAAANALYNDVDAIANKYVSYLAQFRTGDPENERKIRNYIANATNNVSRWKFALSKVSRMARAAFNADSSKSSSIF